MAFLSSDELSSHIAWFATSTASTSTTTTTSTAASRRKLIALPWSAALPTHLRLGPAEGCDPPQDVPLKSTVFTCAGLSTRIMVVGNAAWLQLDRSGDGGGGSGGSSGDGSSNGSNAWSRDLTGIGAWESNVLGTFLCTQPHLFRRTRVLELGCGSGAVGLVAAHVADEVVLTDYSPECLALTRLNAALHPNCERVAVRRLDWTQPSASDALGQFDVVLGSDLFYYATSPLDVVACALRRMTPRGTILMYCRPRTDRAVEDLVAAFQAHGLAWEFVDPVSVVNLATGAATEWLDNSNKQIFVAASRNLDDARVFTRCRDTLKIVDAAYLVDDEW